MKVLRNALKDQKLKTDNFENQIIRLGERNASLEMDIHDSETRYYELYEEYT